MSERTVAKAGLAGSVLVVTYVVVLAGTLMLGIGVLMANAMTCAGGGDGCVDRVTVATIIWGMVSFVLPVAALVWGLMSSRDTAGGRRNRVIALVLIIVLSVLGLAANLAILFVGAG